MPDAQVINPSGVWGYAPTINPTVKWFINGSGAARKPGDLVVMRGFTDGATVTTSTTVSDTTIVAVVAAPGPSDSLTTQGTTISFAAGQDMPCIVEGPARVNVGANTPAVGDLIGTSAVAGAGNTVATPTPGQAIAVALEAGAAKDANNTIRCYVTKV